MKPNERQTAGAIREEHLSIDCMLVSDRCAREMRRKTHPAGAEPRWLNMDMFGAALCVGVVLCVLASARFE
jgi:hypothetical protein